VSPEKRVEPGLKLKPEMCSLDVSSANQTGGVFLNVEVVIDKMAELIKGAGVKPELEVLDVAHIQIASRSIRLGVKNARKILFLPSRS